MGQQKRTQLLLVDSSPGALAELRSELLATGDVEKIVTAESGEAAMRVVKDGPPQAVIANMRLADMSGMRLLLLIKGMYPQILTVMTSDCGSDEARRMCAEAGIDAFFEIPVDVAALMEEVGSLEAREKSFFRGQLSDLKVPDILQLVVSRPVPMLVRLDGPLGEACIEIENGQVIHARCNGRVGEEAFYETAAWETGFFEVINVLCPQERTISASLNNLLVNAARRLSETTTAEEPAGLQEEPEAEFLAEGSASEVGYVWAPMAHYKTPHVKPRSPRRPAEQHDEQPEATSASTDSAASPLKLRATKPVPPISLTSFAPVARPQARGDKRRRRIDWRGHAKELTVAGVAAAIVLVVGLRNMDVTNFSYGRNLAPFFDDLGRRGPSKRAAQADGVQVEAANFDLTQAVHVDDKDVARQLGPDDLGRAGFRETSKPAYRIGFSRAEELRAGMSRVGVDELLFDRLGLAKNPWVELTGPNGISVGAEAVRMRTGVSPILITGAMAEVLLIQGGTLTHLQMQPVAWRTGETKRSRDFTTTHTLSGQYCEYWFSVGLSLQAMRTMGLAPGSYAEVGGPDGFQAARVQLVDKGRPDEIWLSENIREKIGANTSYAAVKVRPKAS